MSKTQFPSLINLIKEIRKKKFKPIYYFFGKDTFMLDEAVEEIDSAISSFIVSDFDKQVFYGSSNSAAEIVDFANMYPFGSEKKLAIVKEPEKIKDLEVLEKYYFAPSEFTVLVIVGDEKAPSFLKKANKKLRDDDLIFEAKELREDDLVLWLQNIAEKSAKVLHDAEARLLLEIVGDDRNFLQNEMQKLINFASDRKEITLDDVKKNAIETREYNIFALQEAIGKRDRKSAFKIGFNMIKRGESIIGMIAMLNKYFLTLAQIEEVIKQKISEAEAAKLVGAHPFYFKNFKFAKKNYTQLQLAQISGFLFEADLSVKTSFTDDLTVLSVLLGNIFSAN